MAEGEGLSDRCRAFVQEQSCGEWDDNTINTDAAKLHTFILQEVNTYPAVEGLVKALEVIEKGGTAVLLDAALTDAPEGFDECPINPKVLEQIVNDARSALSRFRSLQNGGAE